MEYVRLGTTGMKVSRICLGMMSYGSPSWRSWVLSESAAEPIVRRAVDAGIIFFDTADVYSNGQSEEITGRLLRKFFSARDDYVLATKANSPTGPGPNHRGLSRKHIMSAIDDSLRRLGTDHVDLYQIHRFDPETPVEETMEALTDIVRTGKARYIGASSMYAWQFAKLQFTARLHGWSQFVTMQNHYNLLYREEEREMIPLCHDLGVGVLPWSPLARGLLTRRGPAETARTGHDPLHDSLYGDAENSIIEHVCGVAGLRKSAPAQIALAWLLDQPGVTAPIVGATQPHHVNDALAALQTGLTEEEANLLEEPYRPRAIRGHSRG